MCEKMVTGETRSSISFTTAADVVIGTRDWRRSRGGESPFTLFEECPVWPADEQSANPALEQFRAVQSSLSTIPDALLVSIGSAYARHGLHYERMSRFEGTEDPHGLAWRSSTQGMNSTIRPDVIEQALADDELGARAEWLSHERDVR